MMGELPLHIGGEMNCSDQIQIKGDRTDMGSTCTYSGHTELGQPPILNWVVTCHSYDAKGDSIFWRASGNNPVPAGNPILDASSASTTLNPLASMILVKNPK